jgi:hypothetical protein
LRTNVADYGVVLFHTSTSAMQAEAVLGRARLAIRLIPTPRDLSSDCGISLRFAWDQVEQMRALLTRARVETAGVHHLAPR